MRRSRVNEGELWVRFKHNGAMIRIFGGDNRTRCAACALMA